MVEPIEGMVEPIEGMVEPIEAVIKPVKEVYEQIKIKQEDQKQQNQETNELEFTVYIELGGKTRRTKLKKDIKLAELRKLVTCLFMLEESESERILLTYFEDDTESEVILEEDLVEMMEVIA